MATPSDNPPFDGRFPKRTPRRTSRSWTALVAAMAAATLAGGCAQFPDRHPRDWQEQPSLQPQAGPQPRIEGQQPPPPRGQRPRNPPAPPRGCQDPDPAVVATCLAPIGDIAVLPTGSSALVAERETGRVLRVRRNGETTQLARVEVDGAAGGLSGLTLSPTYAEDQLAYAYATTATDNRVVRIAPGEPPEPILTGIPRGARGNSGAITTDGNGALLVATGNAGSPDKANNPAGLAGKVLRIDAFGAPATDNPDPTSRVVASGLSAPLGLCGSAAAGGAWVTDRTAERDVLYQVEPGEPLGDPAWLWRDRPGVSGCVATPRLLIVTLADAAAVYTMRPGPEGTFTGEPQPALRNTYGRFSAATLGPRGMLWLGTANKDGGDPVSSDDRVIRIEPPAGGAAGKD